MDAPSGGKVEDSSVGRAASHKGDEDLKAVRSRRAVSMAVKAAWFSSVMLETMPIRSGTEEGTWSGMPKASEWGRAGAWRVAHC